MIFTLSGEQLHLLPQKGIYWEKHSLLLLSDIHLGKAGHFRKHGIPIPLEVHHHDLQRIDDLISKWSPTNVVFLGDLFHSDLNAEWWNFIAWIHQFPQIHFILVKGNHDILPENLFLEANIQVLEQLVIEPFSFTHIKEENTNYFNLSGHVHPGVRLLGAGKQGITLPCFLFGANYGLLPAFGNFTGVAKVKPKSTDQVFVVTEEKVIQVA